MPGLHAALHRLDDLIAAGGVQGRPLASEALMAMLFQPVFRGEVRGSQHGLGLGLYIAAEIARDHGGTLEVRSDAAQTRFTFRMPIA